MSAIRILPDRVANQIAAGEVIERPVAVIKELVENSLDAGATRIDIEFRNGGKSYMRIDDNGCGMTADDALVALERHGTSKIREAADLNEVSTFGFRGEALPSIASVSKFTLRTRDQSQEHGSEVLVNGGKMIHRKECGMPVGTSIEIEHLFNSVPARRKFLKTENTEAAHIVHLSRLYAVAHAEVSFTLMENGHAVFQSPVCRTLRERVREIFGRQITDDLMEIDAHENDYHLTGLIGKPGIGRSTRQEIVTYVNQRPVDSRTLNYALIEAYHTYVPKGRYPLAFVFLQLDPHAVDVNVHPAKREVRFHDEARLRNFTIQAILDKLREATQSIPHKITPYCPPAPAASQPVTETICAETQSSSASLHLATVSHPGVETLNVPVQPEKETTSPVYVPVPDKPARLSWRFIGFTHGIYALFETGAGLVFLNRNAAQARILYETIKEQMDASQGISQSLLIPVSLELDPLSSTTLEENLEFFNSNGFLIESFGRHYYRVEALPDWLDPARAENFVRDLIASIRERGLNLKRPDLAHEEIARLATTHVAQLDNASDEKAMTALVERLMACKNPLTDPRGRPTFFEYSRTDLEKKFGKW